MHHFNHTNSLKEVNQANVSLVILGIEEYLKDLIKCKEIDTKEYLVMLEFSVANKFEALMKVVLEFVANLS